MKKFITTVIVFGIISLITLYTLDYLVSTGLRKSKSDTYNTINKIVDGTLNADIIINGSSKALVQVSPKILDTILNQNSYNLGMDGNEFIPQLLQYELYKKYNPKPKLIIQIVGNDFLQKKEELIGYMRFAPYLKLNGVSAMTEQYKGFSFIDYHLPFYRYSGYFGLIMDGLLSNFGIHRQIDLKYKGYQEKDYIWDNSFDKFKASNPNGIQIKMNNSSKEKFNQYIESLVQDNIHIIMVYPPTYLPSQDLIRNKKEVINFYKAVAKNNNVLFLDYSSNFISNEKKYFYNSQHLNKNGAERFTKLLAEDIKSTDILNKK
ncbi:hypothetical protein [Maribacter ulvicola]|uniref:Uncharacterized protein n=1 Tax=Maribacter ulvicola TaxID=228959 RepID=A0A1N6VJJ8_9FLAO|nr:hypothetical protein [Maribacter ulvicola]SIQ77947.1 hypothetical protein SAMN05421797_103154 [Maribacter ulvicola]